MYLNFTVELLGYCFDISTILLYRLSFASTPPLSRALIPDSASETSVTYRSLYISQSIIYLLKYLSALYSHEAVQYERDNKTSAALIPLKLAYM